MKKTLIRLMSMLLMLSMLIMPVPAAFMEEAEAPVAEEPAPAPEIEEPAPEEAPAEPEEAPAEPEEAPAQPEEIPAEPEESPVEEQPGEDENEDIQEAPQVASAPAVSSASASDSKTLKGTTVTFTVKTPTTAKYLAMYVESGSKVKTWNGSTYYTDSGSTRTWKVSYAIGSAGDRTLTFKASINGTNYGAGKDVSLTVKAFPTVSSAAASSSKILKGTTVTFTVKTSTDAAYLAMYAETGSKVKAWNGSTYYTDSGSTRTWKVTYAIGSAGSRKLTFKASPNGTNYGTGKAVSIEVLADLAVTSATASPTTVAKGSPITFTVKTPADANYLRMFAETGTGVKSWTASSSSTVSGSVRTWTVTYTIANAGSRTLTFKASLNNKNFGTGKAVNVEIVTSTAPAVTSAKAGTTTTSKGSDMLFTVVTPKEAQYLTMYSESDAKVKTWTASGNVTDSGSTRTWTIVYNIRSTGNRTLTFKASADGTTYGEGKTASFSVVASTFTYGINDTKDGVILTKYTGSSSSVTVREVYCGLPMVKIGDSCFEGNTSIESVTLPSTVKVIGKRAFANCSKLKTMN